MKRVGRIWRKSGIGSTAANNPPRRLANHFAFLVEKEERRSCGLDFFWKAVFIATDTTAFWPVIFGADTFTSSCADTKIGQNMTMAGKQARYFLPDLPFGPVLCFMGKEVLNGVGGKDLTSNHSPVLNAIR